MKNRTNCQTVEIVVTRSEGVVWEMDRGLRFMTDTERTLWLTTHKLPDHLVVIVPPIDHPALTEEQHG